MQKQCIYIWSSWLLLHLCFYRCYLSTWSSRVTGADRSLSTKSIEEEQDLPLSPTILITKWEKGQLKKNSSPKCSFKTINKIIWVLSQLLNINLTRMLENKNVAKTIYEKQTSQQVFPHPILTVTTCTESTIKSTTPIQRAETMLSYPYVSSI